jgi:signal transduction histidine kinase
MKNLKKSRSQEGRAGFVVVLLLLTLGLTAVLAYEAQTAARSHRAATTSALSDHAAFVGWQFADHAAAKLDHKIVTPGLLYVMSLEDAPRDQAAPLVEPPSILRYVFRLDLASGSLAVRGPQQPSDAVRAWAREALAVAARDFDPEWDHAIVAGAPDERSHLLVYDLEYDKSGDARTVRGFEVEESKLPYVFSLAYGYPLVPPSLTGGADNSEVLSVQVLGPAGDTLFASEPQYASDFTATEHISDQHAGLAVEVALRFESADALIIRGLPPSRLPLLLGLLILAGGLVAAAIFVLRREMEFAQLRADFVSNVSHELRTPLAQIRMFAETLLLGRVRSDDERRRGLEIIDKEARRLSHLVANILAFSRAERNGTRLNIEPTELSPQLSEVLDAFAPLASAKGVTIRGEPVGDVVAEVDASAVRQIILNLLDNAVKYGPEGQTVTVGMEQAVGRVKLWVDDEGPGVPREKWTDIWKPFSRLNRENENAVAGTGIGLSVVRELATQHNGRAWVEDSPGGGARFVVELPAAAPEPAPAGA